MLLALNPKTQFGLPEPYDNVLEERIEWNSKSTLEPLSASYFRFIFPTTSGLYSRRIIKMLFNGIADE